MTNTVWRQKVKIRTRYQCYILACQFTFIWLWYNPHVVQECAFEPASTCCYFLFISSRFHLWWVASLLQLLPFGKFSPVSLSNFLSLLSPNFYILICNLYVFFLFHSSCSLSLLGLSSSLLYPQIAWCIFPLPFLSTAVSPTLRITRAGRADGPAECLLLANIEDLESQQIMRP